MTDEEFTKGDKVRFLQVFDHISDSNIPVLFLHEEKEDKRNEGELVRELEVDNGFSFGRGVLGYTRSSGCEPNLNKVPQDIIDKHLKIVDRIPIVKYPGRTMNIGDGDDEKIISMEKKGEYVFIEGIAEKQKQDLRETVKYYLEKGVSSHDKFDDEQLEILSKFLGIKPKEDPKVIQYKNENDMLMAFANMIQQNPPKFDKEYEDFITDLMKKPDSKKRRYIKSRAEQKLYHDFESRLAGPKMALAEDLSAAGFDDMVQKVYSGDYDF